MKPRFIAVLSSYRLLYHGIGQSSIMADIRNCLQADGTHKTNLYGYPTLIVGTKNITNIFMKNNSNYLSQLISFNDITAGVSDMARVFHPLAITMSTNEDAPMFQFIGNIYSIVIT